MGAHPDSAPVQTACFHCGEPCPDDTIHDAEKVFCCHGCLTVYEILSESGLDQFYRLEDRPGVRVDGPAEPARFAYLDDPQVRDRILDFSEGRTSRVTLRIPSIHCAACVWLLENLFRLNPGIGRCQVNFPKREFAAIFDHEQISLSGLVTLLSSLGYEPELNLTALDRNPSARADPATRTLHLKLGVAGFCFANIMLMSLPAYLGLDEATEGLLGTFFRYGCLLLALPVLFFGASDYLRAAGIYARRRILTIDFPIALGITALFLQSAFDILTNRGTGYLDSFAGLVFFLLCGRWFQQKTYDALSFERDYKSFFPLSVVRRSESGDATIPISGLGIGDRILLRNGELIPSDARLVDGPALIDYSFVTGESDPVAKEPGERLYAGGRQMGGRIELVIDAEVSQSYLTSLWSNDVFSKEEDPGIQSLTNRVSRYFTGVVLSIAVIACLYWLNRDPAQAIPAFSAVLIVACPCALALSAPFALGTALRILGRIGVYVKNVHVVEALTTITDIVFDKTGTLTEATQRGVSFHGPPLSPDEAALFRELAGHSTHPHALRLVDALDAAGPIALQSSQEIPGCGIEGDWNGTPVRLGSPSWLREGGVPVPDQADEVGSRVCGSIGSTFRGVWALGNIYRARLEDMVAALRPRYRLSVLSGDQERERQSLGALFGPEAELSFNQSPAEKLEAIRRLQAGGARVLMIGDGLNDAGALKQSQVGVAISENVAAFSPACDVILSAASFNRIPGLLQFARKSVRVVWFSIGISFLYNVVGVSLAAAGLLSPVLCAILMPVSSITVVVFAAGSTSWAGRILQDARSHPSKAADLPPESLSDIPDTISGNPL